ncbi:MAG TPA: trypsin-like peptidase domain-containing protein [Pseudonocardia sp.]|nr:trypsin-like peptidase domain-containing protein [Pseudonocardia sp.]
MSPHRQRPAGGVPVVAITAQLSDGSGTAGSGIVLTSTGLVLTNQHVVAGAVELQATSGDSRAYPAVIVGTDPARDIALIQLEDATGLPTARIGHRAWVDEPVVAIGNAWGSEITMTRGLVTRLHQSISATSRPTGPATGASQLGVSRTGVMRDLIQVDAGIVPGESGGALVDDHDRVVGVIVAYIPAHGADTDTAAATGEGYAIPISAALHAADQLAHSARPHTAQQPTGSAWPTTTWPVHGGWGR